MIRGVFLCGSGICAMKEYITLVVVERKLPTIERVLPGGFEEGTEHPICGRGLQDGVDNQGTYSDFSQRKSRLKAS